MTHEPTATRVLVVDDEPSMREFLDILLRKLSYDCDLASSGEEAIERVDAAEYAAVITDLKMEGPLGGLDVLRHIKEVSPSTQVIVMTAFATPETAVQALKQGAYDYLTKPFRIDLVRAVIERAVEKSTLLSENLYLRRALEGQHGYEEMVGASPAIKKVFQLIERVAPSRTTVLIQGESGTGKELVARAIHERSGLKGPFIPVNCGAIPENLIEAELFGYVKGAFTGADADRDGLFQAANGGTLFLDELGELPSGTQVRLLRVLQEKMVKPVGGHTERPTDVRIVAATNRDLRAEVDAGRFREDLFYRLAVISIDVPPLRRRPSDVRLLLEHYVRKYASEIGSEVVGLEKEALHHLLAYAYPGNVRELQNIVERAVTLELGTLVTTESLPAHVIGGRASSTKSPPLEWTESGANLEEILESVERDYLVRALELTDGNRTEAAKLLHISFRSIRYRLRKYGFGD